MMPRPSVGHKSRVLNSRSIASFRRGGEGRGAGKGIEQTYVLGRMESQASLLSAEGGCLNRGSLVKVLAMGPGGSR